MMPPRSKSTHIDLFMQMVEPNPLVLERDLRQLAAYLIKIGADVNIVTDRQKRHRLLKHPNLRADWIEHMVEKYQLTWNRNSNSSSSFGQQNRTLIQLATNYPKIFIYEAALLSPGSYEERRFWWCANNREFYEKYSDNKPPESISSSTLLSDILAQLLTMDEPKLIVISALHMSIKHSEQRVFREWFINNKISICKQIGENELGKHKPEEKKYLRKIHRIIEAERELNPIDVDHFLEWWNLTGLRRPYQFV